MRRIVLIVLFWLLSSLFSFAQFGDRDWQVADVDAYGDVGLNASIAIDPAGNPHIGYATPPENPQTKTLLEGGSVEFVGIYQLQLVVDILNYLLGIANDPAGLVPNGDTSIDVADIIALLP